MPLGLSLRSSSREMSGRTSSRVDAGFADPAGDELGVWEPKSRTSTVSRSAAGWVIPASAERGEFSRVGMGYARGGMEPPGPTVALDSSAVCRGCSYSLRGLRAEDRCPECGTPVADSGKDDGIGGCPLPRLSRLTVWFLTARALNIGIGLLILGAFPMVMAGSLLQAETAGWLLVFALLLYAVELFLLTQVPPVINRSARRLFSVAAMAAMCGILWIAIAVTVRPYHACAIAIQIRHLFHGAVAGPALSDGVLHRLPLALHRWVPAAMGRQPWLRKVLLAWAVTAGGSTACITVVVWVRHRASEEWLVTRSDAAWQMLGYTESALIVMLLIAAVGIILSAAVTVMLHRRARQMLVLRTRG